MGFDLKGVDNISKKAEHDKKAEEGTLTLKEEPMAEQQTAKSGLGIIGFKKNFSESFKKQP